MNLNLKNTLRIVFSKRAGFYLLLLKTHNNFPNLSEFIAIEDSYPLKSCSRFSYWLKDFLKKKKLSNVEKLLKNSDSFS